MLQETDFVYISHCKDSQCVMHLLKKVSLFFFLNIAFTFIEQIGKESGTKRNANCFCLIANSLFVLLSETQTDMTPLLKRFQVSVGIFLGQKR